MKQKTWRVMVAFALVAVFACAPVRAESTAQITGQVTLVQGILHLDFSPAGCVLFVNDGTETVPVYFYNPTNPGDACRQYWTGKTVQVDAVLSPIYCMFDHCYHDRGVQFWGTNFQWIR